MALKIGSSTVDAVKLGTSNVDAIYLGAANIGAGGGGATYRLLLNSKAVTLTGKNLTLGAP